MGSYRGHCFLRVLFLLAAACFLPCSIALPRRGFPSSSNCHDTNPADDASLTSRTPAVDARAVNRSELVVGNQIAVPAVRSKIPARSFIPTTAGKIWLQIPDTSPEFELARHMRSKIPVRPFMPTTMAGKFWLQALDISPESELAGHMRSKMAGNLWLQRDYLPLLLRTLEISPESELAGHMHRTLSVCEDAGRRKAGRCATSAAAMAEFARSKAGASALKMLQPSMASQDDPSMAMIKGLKVKEGVLTCHALIFPFQVYLCENIHKTAIEVELESGNGERVSRVVECDVDHIPNKCTWVGDESVVWVKNEQESEENIWMNQKWGHHHHHDFFANFYSGSPYDPPPPSYSNYPPLYPPPYGPSYPPYPSYRSPTNFNTKNGVPAGGININNKIQIGTNLPSSGTTSNANSNPNNPNSNTSNLNSNSNGLSGTNSIPSSSGLSNTDPLSSTGSSSSGDQSSDLNTPSSKSNSSKSSLSSSSDLPSSKSSLSSSSDLPSSKSSLSSSSDSPSDDTSTSPPSSSSSSTSSSSDDTTGKRISSTSSKGSGL